MRQRANLGDERHAAAPDLPGLALEYTPTLFPPAWRATDLPALRTNGFYRYRLVK